MFRRLGNHTVTLSNVRDDVTRNSNLAVTVGPRSITRGVGSLKGEVRRRGGRHRSTTRGGIPTLLNVSNVCTNSGFPLAPSRPIVLKESDTTTRVIFSRKTRGVDHQRYRIVFGDRARRCQIASFSDGNACIGKDHLPTGTPIGLTHKARVSLKSDGGVVGLLWTVECTDRAERSGKFGTGSSATRTGAGLFAVRPTFYHGLFFVSLLIRKFTNGKYRYGLRREQAKCH